MQVEVDVHAREGVCEWKFSNPAFVFKVGQDLNDFLAVVSALDEVAKRVRIMMAEPIDPQDIVSEATRIIRESQIGSPGINVNMVPPTVAMYVTVARDEPELWRKTINGIADAVISQTHGNKLQGPALTVKMPCGETLVINTVEEIRALEVKDVPCPCGKPDHYLLKFQVVNRPQ